MADTTGIKQTPNIGLYQPDYANIADIQVLDENFEILDKANTHDLTIYVDAGAPEVGDGSREKPFQTVQEAIDRGHLGKGVVYIEIAEGNYPERITTPRAPHITWRITGTGTVTLQGALFDDCNYAVLSNLTFSMPTGTVANEVVQIANCNNCAVIDCTINGRASITALVINNSRARLQNIKINNSGSAIGANNNSYVFAHQTSGTNNAVGLHADGAIINVIKNDIVATTPYVRMAGGVIHTENGDQAYPSNFTPRKFIGDYTNVDELRARLMAEMQALGVGESIACYFGNNLADGFGIYSANQRMQVDITKSTDYGNGYGTCIFRSHHDATPFGFMRIQDGSFVDAFPVAVGAGVKDASISGKTITLTFADGTTKKLTTQDTAINYMPSTSKITISLSGEQQDYTAPADGWISVSCKTTTSSCIQAFALVNNTNNMQVSQTMHASGKMARGFLPVSKGHNITVYWASGGTNERNMEFVHING